MRFFLLCITFSTLLAAAPAFEKERIYTQSDGTTFKAKPQGDEYLHFLKTTEGAILLYNPVTKNFDYAKIENDRLVPSGTPYKTGKTKLRKSAAYSSRPAITPQELQRVYIKAKERFRHHQR